MRKGEPMRRQVTSSRLLVWLVLLAASAGLAGSGAAALQERKESEPDPPKLRIRIINPVPPGRPVPKVEPRPPSPLLEALRLAREEKPLEAARCYEQAAQEEPA